MLKIMRYLNIYWIVLCFPVIVVASDENPFQNEKDREDLLKLSEGFGYFIGSNLQNPGIKFDLDRFIKGIRDGASGKSQPISDEEFENLLATFQEKALATIAEENLKDANAFLEDNLDNIDVFEIVKGRLQYEILTPGKGPRIEENGAPLVHLLGKLLDGTVIISTEASGTPIELPLDQTIPGLQKGINKMQEGEKRRLYIHPEYGAGISDDLPPNTVLIIDVEVIKANNHSDLSEATEIEQEGNEELTLILEDDDEFDEVEDFFLPPW